MKCLKLSSPERRKSMDRVVWFRPYSEGSSSVFFILCPITPKTGTQIQIAKAESDTLMLMF